MVTRIREDNGGFDPFGDMAAAGVKLVEVNGEELAEALVAHLESNLEDYLRDHLREEAGNSPELAALLRGLVDGGMPRVAIDIFMLWDAHFGRECSPEQMLDMQVAIHSMPGAQAWYRLMTGLDS